jgi:hypothetical protein
MYYNYVRIKILLLLPIFVWSQEFNTDTLAGYLTMVSVSKL